MARSATAIRPHRGLRCALARPLSAVSLVASFAFATLATLTSMSAQGREQLRVRADSELVNLGLSRDATTVEVTGGLRDDAGHPIVDALVSLPVSGESAQPAACRSSERVQTAGGAVAVRTDGLGFFCV